MLFLYGGGVPVFSFCFVFVWNLLTVSEIFAKLWFKWNETSSYSDIVWICTKQENNTFSNIYFLSSHSWVSTSGSPNNMLLKMALHTSKVPVPDHLKTEKNKKKTKQSWGLELYYRFTRCGCTSKGRLVYMERLELVPPLCCLLLLQWARRLWRCAGLRGLKEVY